VDADLSNRIGEAAERFVPGEAQGGLIEVEHLARYWWASGLASGRRVLDAGCGAGYGTAMLATAGASETIGVDVAPHVVEAAARAHAASRFVVGDLHELPFPDGRFDLVVCFEVIEHVEGQDAAIAELDRVLAPDGMLAISSPNRGVYPSGNPHHRHEYVPDELEEALRRRFAHVELRRQHDWVASAILDDAQVADADLGRLDVDVGKVVSLEPASETYTLALASRQPLPAVGGRVILGDVGGVRAGLMATAMREELERVRTDVATLLASEERLAADVERLQARLRAIHESAAWRLSKPLRAVLRRLR
jgi:SAM-dependent methyltransferase